MTSITKTLALSLAVSLPLTVAAEDLSKTFSAAQQAAAAAMADRSSLSLGRCALGATRVCFNELLRGLPPEDRSFVRLSGSRVVVDTAHQSDSPNFTVLRRVANTAQGRTIIEVLSPSQSFNILGATSWPAAKLEAISTPMGSPRTQSGFEGYTFFPYRGRIEKGILYSDGPYTLVEVNTDELNRDTVAETIHHELRHVVLGSFGQTALKAKHGLPAVERATRQAEDEAKRYERATRAS